MILQARDIADLILEPEDEEDPLCITPRPNLEDLKVSGAASVDLRLGTWFLASRARRVPFLDITKEEESEERFTRMTYVPFRGVYILHPRSFVLGATLEWIRMPRNLAGYITGKSSWGRRGLIIETAMGIHPSFSGSLTLELANVGNVPIVIRPGMLICQVFFHETTEGTDFADQSQHVGHGRPVLGSLKEDPTVQLLGDEELVVPLNESQGPTEPA